MEKTTTLAGESAHTTLQSRAGRERGKRQLKEGQKPGAVRALGGVSEGTAATPLARDWPCCELLLGPAPGRASRQNARGGQGQNFSTCSEDIKVRHWHQSRDTEQKRLTLTRTFSDQSKLFRMSPCGTDSPLVAETQLRCVSVPLHF